MIAKTGLNYTLDHDFRNFISILFTYGINSYYHNQKQWNHRV